MDVLGDRPDLFDRPLEARGRAVAVRHAVRSIERDDDTRAALADTRGHLFRIFHERLRKGSHQQQDREAAEAEQNEIPQPELPRTDAHAAVKKLHRRPVGALDLIAIEQVREDRQRHPERREQQ